MEEFRPLKCLRSVTPSQDGHPRSLGSPDVDHKDPVQADGRVERGQPTKPFAYVKPIRREAPTVTEPAPLAGRRRRRVVRDPNGEESHTGERRRRRRAVLPRDDSPHPELGHVLGPTWHRELDHHVEPEASQATSVQGDTLPGSGHQAFQVGARVQLLPDDAGYWDLRGFPTSGVYASIGFSPLAGSALRVVQTSYGTYVSGVPEFFTHIAY
nr:proline-rich protein 20G [Dasypus novemcinctus]